LICAPRSSGSRRQAETTGEVPRGGVRERSGPASDRTVIRGRAALTLAHDPADPSQRGQLPAWARGSLAAGVALALGLPPRIDRAVTRPPLRSTGRSDRAGRVSTDVATTGHLARRRRRPMPAMVLRLEDTLAPGCGRLARPADTLPAGGDRGSSCRHAAWLQVQRDAGAWGRGRRGRRRPRPDLVRKDAPTSPLTQMRWISRARRAWQTRRYDLIVLRRGVNLEVR